ncbi:hypothetical protein PVAND_009196 [Polypedilum vanderplanki]|uniref:Alkyl transferase n=1 Tax=Polypedilum vanderplanki TaxID=319348 RepID=A0A9J6CCD2_POLVA|nr:hypothetical protein PVAND_009196 [Polypedilum vanderplanki]
MSWIRNEELKLSFFENLAIKIIKQGPIPKHIAFIMDGNRRWATNFNLNKSEGHEFGSEKLSKILKWCPKIGIKEVTVYAFSIENFKRSQDEVNAIMKLFIRKLLEKEQELHEKGIKVKVIGNLDMLPNDVQKVVADAMLSTKDNSKLNLNIAFAYTSREEITNSIKTIVEGVENNELISEDLYNVLIDECMYTNQSSPVDLLVRTSGEMRFSDFLLWQIPSTVFYFTETLWPDFTLWHLLAAVFYYQRNYTQAKALKEYFNQTRPAITNNPRVDIFLANLEEKRHAKLVEMSQLM